MVTPLKSANTIDFQRAREQEDVARGLALQTGLPEEGVRYRLLNRLQTTLSLDRLITLFHDELSIQLELQGLRYLHETRQLQHMAGSASSHSCGYRLHTQHGDLGEIIVYRDRRLSDQELTIIESFLVLLVYPLRNALQYRDVLEASVTDPLTGAGNRSALDATLKREIALARRYGSPLALLMIDIDKFKAINDEHGHSIGDAVLKDTVKLLDATHRGTDMCFRFGGEEFVIVLNRTDHEGAMIIADRIRQRIADTLFHCCEPPLRVTVSIGVSDYAAADDADSLFERADQALYQIKQQGGNQAGYRPGKGQS